MALHFIISPIPCSSEMAPVQGSLHLNEELQKVVAHTQYGDVFGGRAHTGAAVWLEIPYALPPSRFQDPVPLPQGFKYDEKLYITESAYGVQPKNDGQAEAMGVSFEDKVGRGQPTENPLFLNIVAPPSFPYEGPFPVKVYIHGGFLQFGSPHGLSGQAQFIAAERKEIWVNIGYRLSAFGFLACDMPKLDGNYGFKDQWLALKWIKENISAFGGDPNDVHLTGLSGGAHSVHQILHHVSLLPEGTMAPFQTAAMQSNAILTDPKPPAELRTQFRTLCQGLKLDPDDPNILNILRDPKRVPWNAITELIETDSLGNLGQFGTFRGCLSGDWIITSPGPMERQRSGALASSLKAHGVTGVMLGDLIDEWYLYSFAHPISSYDDILPNLDRYLPSDISKKLLHRISACGEEGGDPLKLFGDVLSIGQVLLPGRVFARDMIKHGFPVVFYSIKWTPENVRPFGYVTHGTDRVFWALRKPDLDSKNWIIATGWVDAVHEQLKKLIQHKRSQNPRIVFTLKDDQSFGWSDDGRWEQYMDLVDILPGE